MSVWAGSSEHVKNWKSRTRVPSTSSHSRSFAKSLRRVPSKFHITTRCPREGFQFLRGTTSVNRYYSPTPHGKEGVSIWAIVPPTSNTTTLMISREISKRCGRIEPLCQKTTRSGFLKTIQRRRLQNESTKHLLRSRRYFTWTTAHSFATLYTRTIST